MTSKMTAVSPHPRVAAIFATMNRKDNAMACVKALAAQRRPPSLVIVADNVSTDGTAVALESLGELPFHIIVHRMDKNLGNAGGIQKAAEIAFSLDVDAIWILDDDSLPRKGALEQLIYSPWNPEVVRHAIQIDPSKGTLTWPMWIPHEYNWKLAFHPDDLPDSDYFSSRSAWTGALVSREIWNAIGPIKGELFIRGEDEEYPWRIATHGFTFEAATQAILDHPGPSNLIHRRFAGKNIFYEKGLSDWKLYYKVRNMVWLKRQQSGMIKAMAMFITYGIAAVIFDGPRRIALILEAGRDGLNEHLGKWGKHID